MKYKCKDCGNDFEKTCALLVLKCPKCGSKDIFITGGIMKTFIIDTLIVVIICLIGSLISIRFSFGFLFAYVT